MKDKVLREIHASPREKWIGQRTWLYDVVSKKLSQLGNFCGDSRLPSARFIAAKGTKADLVQMKLANGAWEVIFQWHLHRAISSGAHILSSNKRRK